MTSQAQRRERAHFPAASARTSRAPGGGERADRVGRERVPLRVVGARDLARRARARAATRTVVTSAAIIVVALLVAAGAQAYVAEQQLRIDSTEQQLTSAVALSQSLQLSRAELSSPGRVLAVAEHALKMVSPATVHDLRPVRPGPSVAALAHDVAVPAPVSVPVARRAGAARP